MDITLIVADYLAKAGFGTVGTDIFVGQIPDTTNGVYVLKTGGLPQNYIPIEEAVVDIYVKDLSATAAVQKIENIKRFIHRMHNTTQGQAYIYTFLIIGDTEDVQRDLQYEKIYKITLQVMFRNETLIS
jgi:hypothetical protein